MYEEQQAYPTTAAAQMSRGMIGGAGAAMAKNAIEKPRLAMQLDQLEKLLAGGHHLATSLNSVADRLMGPVPENADGSKQTSPPPPSTIEQRFAMAIGNTEDLLRRLEQASRRLNTAV
jgi:hypothetical protein